MESRLTGGKGNWTAERFQVDVVQNQSPCEGLDLCGRHHAAVGILIPNNLSLSGVLFWAPG